MRMLKSFSKHNHQTVPASSQTANISARMTETLIGPQLKQDVKIQIYLKKKKKEDNTQACRRKKRMRGRMVTKSL